jgi:hypothetical protein
MKTPPNFGGYSDPVELEGQPPVWEYGLFVSEPGPFYMYPSGPTSTPYPGIKVNFLVGPDYMQAVTLQGRDLLSGTPLWFDMRTNGDDPHQFTMLATLDPTHPNNGIIPTSQGQWNVWGIVLIFTHAGCYDLQVSWAGGAWQAVIAVGR